jgi:transaldolase
VRRPAIFLDRDGTIVRALVRDGRPYPPAGVEDLDVPADVPSALGRLAQAGFALVVVTNQPDVARGARTRASVEAINAALAARLPIAEFRVCYHDDDDRCACRKPKPGLLLQPPAYDVGRSVLIGDRWRDIEAGRRAGVAATILIDAGHAEPCDAEPDLRVRSLGEAADWILASRQPAENHTRTESSSRPMTTMKNLADLQVKIFGDGADLPRILELSRLPYISGFTTNPTLMNKAGIRDYRAFAREVVAAIPDRPVSFEVFSDEFAEMERQALEIATWGPSVYVKIPVTNTRRESACELIGRLSHAGVKVNVTAVMTPQQVGDVVERLQGGAPSCVSVFAGRIADTGRDPLPLMIEALSILRAEPKVELIWASPRELLNIFQADAIGCHIITVTHDILARLANVGKDLDDYSLETVRMFHDDARRAGFSL